MIKLVKVLVPFDQQALVRISVKTFCHNTQTGLLDLVLIGQEQEHCSLHLRHAILCLQYQLQDPDSLNCKYMMYTKNNQYLSIKQ